MPTGWEMKMTGQTGEYLIASELCRRGFVATTFTGNVPYFDIIASNESGTHIPIQVKTIRRGSWQFANLRQFMDVQLSGREQIIGDPKVEPYPGLIMAFVKLGVNRTQDQIFLLKWTELRELAIQLHSGYLEKHGRIRPRKFDSFHLGVLPEDIESYRNRWSLLTE